MSFPGSTRSGARGSVEHIGQLIPADQATTLGDHVLAEHNRKIELQGHWYGNPDGQFYAIEHDRNRPSMTTEDEFDHRAYLPETDHETIALAIGAFKEILPTKLQSRSTILSADLLVGTAASGTWHIDGDFDYRAIVNLSSGVLGLMTMTTPLQATTEFQPQWDGLLGPPIEQQQGLLFYPGEGLALDNTGDPALLVPHAGIKKTGKVMLRLFARPPYSY